MALEEKVLEILGRRAATWDQLRGELGAAPDELDAAIQALERTKAVHRDRGRFHLNGAALKSTTEGGAMATKACSNCGETKAPDEFPKKGAQCKACIAAKAKAWYRAKQGKPTRSKAKASAPARRAKASRTSSTPPPRAWCVGTARRSAFQRRRAHRSDARIRDRHHAVQGLHRSLGGAVG